MSKFTVTGFDLADGGDLTGVIIMKRTLGGKVEVTHFIHANSLTDEEIRRTIDEFLDRDQIVSGVTATIAG